MISKLSDQIQVGAVNLSYQCATGIPPGCLRTDGRLRVVSEGHNAALYAFIHLLVCYSLSRKQASTGRDRQVNLESAKTLLLSSQPPQRWPKD